MYQQPDADPRDQALGAAEPKLKPVALVQLIATVTLAVSTLIIATAVSIGLARADVANNVVSVETSAAVGKISNEPR
jgi:hypothetical protein